MALQHRHDESPGSPLTDAWFHSLVESLGLKATGGTLVAVVRSRSSRNLQSPARVLTIPALFHPRIPSSRNVM